MVRFLAVEPVHLDSSSRLGTGCSHFTVFISGFNGVVRSMVGDVLVDSEAPLVTSSISRCAGTVF